MYHDQLRASQLPGGNIPLLEICGSTLRAFRLASLLGLLQPGWEIRGGGPKGSGVRFQFCVGKDKINWGCVTVAGGGGISGERKIRFIGLMPGSTRTTDLWGFPLRDDITYEKLGKATISHAVRGFFFFFFPFDF